MKKLLLIVVLIMLMAGMVWATEKAKEAEPTKFADDSFLAANGTAPSGGMLLGGGPDAYGYVWKDSRDAGGPVYNWVDISGIGTEITPWPHGTVDDGYTDLIPMGITFSYYGTDYTDITVSTNGWLSFEAQTSSYLSNAAIPTAAVPNTIIAPLWDDLDGGTVGHVYYYNDAAQHRFIVSWVNWPYYPDPTDPKDFQVILDADDSTMVFQYGAGAFTQTDITVGIENQDGTVGLQVAYNVNYPINNLAMKISRPPLLAHNVGVNAILSPGATTYIDTSYVVSCNVRNFGLNTETNVPVRYQIFDSTGTVVYNNTFNIPSLASETDYEVDFPNWVPAQANRHTFKAYTSLAGDLDRTNDTTYAYTNTLTHRGTGGPAEYWYFADNINGGGPAFNWIDITGTGTPLSFTNVDDGNSGLFDTGTNFNFFGVAYSQIAVSTNGWLSFTDGSTTGLSNTTIPSTGAPNTLIALLWDDLDLDVTGTVYYQYDLDQNQFIVEYYGVQFYRSPNDGLTFNMEVILDGNANSIKMQYDAFTGPVDTDISIGIENSTGTVGLAYDNNGEVLQTPYSGVAITYTYNPPSNDVGVTSILSPGPISMVGSALTVSAEVHNFGSANQATVPVRFMIQDSTGATIYNQTQNIFNIGPDFDVTVTFPNWTPSVAGPYSLKAMTSLGGDFNVHNDTTLASTRAYQHRSSGSADLWSYVDNFGGGPAFNWIDITAIGTPVTFSSLDDGYSGFIDMGMSYSFYNEVYDRVALSTNGWMSFVDSASSVRFDTLMPDPIVPNALIAFLWDDLHIGTGAVYYYYDSVNNLFIVQYNNVEFYPLGGGDCIDMEVILNGTTGSIKMQYNNFCTGSESDISIGIENQDGTLGLPYDNHGEIGQTPVNGLAITYTYTLFAHDIAAREFVGLLPAGSVGAPITPQVTFRNSGTSTETNIPVRLQIAPGTYNNVQSIPSLAPGASATITFANFTPTSGALYTLTSTAQLPSDQNHANDVVTGTYNVYDILYDFEGGSGGFTATGNWEWGSPTSGPNAAFSGVNCWATNLAGNYTAGLSELIFNLNLGTTSPAVSFTHWYDTEARFDGGNLGISTDGGASWNVISPVDGYDDSCRTANPLYPDSIFTGHVHSFWGVETFQLSAFAGQAVMARLAFGADGSLFYSGWYVDDMGLTDCSLAAPEIGYNPPSLSGSAPVGNSDTDILTISNTGTYTLFIDATPHILPPAALRTLSMTPSSDKASISRKYEVKPESPVDDTKRVGEVILQGGEDIANATVIPALPYNDFGSTVGAINDYDEPCPGGTGTAGDVVYSYAPIVDQFVTISLCGSSYDTKLIVYENEYTPGSAFACDDDACPGLQSEIIGLGLTGGSTYYIVVDGYSANEGDYTIDVFETPPPPGCPAENVIFSQVPTTPSDSWAFVTSDVEPGYINFESFVNFYGEVSEIHFFGIDAYNDGTGWTECDEDPAAVEIKFYADDNGLPGTVQATYDVSISPVATGQTFDGTVPFTQKEYVATISPAYSMYEGWISIQGTSSGDNCWLLWQNSVSGADGRSLAFDGSTYTVNNYDLSLCLVGTPRSPWLSIDNSHLEIPVGNTGTITANMSAVNLSAGTYNGVIAMQTNDPDEGTLDIPVVFTVTGGGGPGCHYVIGDINGNGALNGIDVTYGVSYFKGGSLPPYTCECTPGNTWFVAGDVNGSCVFNGIDITYLVAYFKGGLAPRGCASCPPTLQVAPALAPTKVMNLGTQQ